MKRNYRKHYIIECRDRKLRKVTFKAFGKYELKKILRDLHQQRYLEVSFYESEDN